MLKKFISSLTALVCALTCITSGYVTAGAESTYSDVPDTHWAKEYVERCCKTGWFSGYPDGTFHPDASISRAEACKVFVTFLSEPLSTVTSSSFYDVSPTAWYAPYVEAGKDLFPKRASLDGQQKFQPEMPVTREDVIHALVVALRYDHELEFEDQSILNMYSDANSITDSVKPYVAKATALGLVTGDEYNRIGAQDPLTRAQFAKLLYFGTLLPPDPTRDERRREASVDVYPSSYTEMLVGDSLEVMAVTNYTDGSSEPYTGAIGAYCDKGEDVITINKNKITAIGEGISVVRFNDEKLDGKDIIISVKDTRGAPVIQLGDVEKTTSSETAVITGTVTDPSGSALTLSCNNSAILLNSDGTFSLTVNLTMGDNVFEFKAASAAKKESAIAVTINRTQPEPTAMPTPEPQVTPEPTAAPVYSDDDPVEMTAELIKAPTEDDRTAVVRVSYSGFTTAKVVSAKFVLKADDDIFEYNSSKSKLYIGGSMRYQKVDKGVRFLYSDNGGCAETEQTLADIAFDVSDGYDLSAVSISDFDLTSVSIKNSTFNYDESAINISLK